MAKKDIFNKGATTMANATPEKKIGIFQRILRFPVRVFTEILNFPQRVFNLITGKDKMAALNAVLMIILIIMFAVIMVQTVGRRQSSTTTATAPRQEYNLAERLKRRDKPTIAKAAPCKPQAVTAAAPCSRPVAQVVCNRQQPAKKQPTQIVTGHQQVIFARGVTHDIPRAANCGKASTAAECQRIMSQTRQTQIAVRCRPAAPAAQPRRQIAGTLRINGHGHVKSLQPNTTIDGDLILQNFKSFTIPCGTIVTGNLMLRDVNNLRFCDADGESFEVRGNIHLSRNSSFGSIPSSARLGGQIVLSREVNALRQQALAQAELQRIHARGIADAQVIMGQGAVAVNRMHAQGLADAIRITGQGPHREIQTADYMRLMMMQQLAGGNNGMIVIPNL